MPAHLKDIPETQIRAGICLTALLRFEEWANSLLTHEILIHILPQTKSNALRLISLALSKSLTCY